MGDFSEESTSTRGRKDPNRLGLVPASGPVCVGWVAGRDTVKRLGYVLNPLAVGLVDDLVKLVLFCPEDADAGDLPSPPIELVRHAPYKWPFRKQVIADLVEQATSRKVQLVHALDCSTIDLTRRLAQAGRFNYVVSSYNLAVVHRMHRLNGHLARILAACERIELRLIKRHVAAAEKVLRVPPGVHPAKRSRCFRDPRHSVAIVACGILANWRTLAALAACFAQLRQRGYDCVFMVIGSGRMETRLREEVAKLGLQQHVTFADQPTSSQLAGIMKAADIFISFDPGRQIDLASLTAMASGVPALAARDREDFIIDGKTAIVFDPSSASQLTDKVAGLLDDHASARALAESALEYVRRMHSPASMAAAVARTYRQAIETGVP